MVEGVDAPDRAALHKDFVLIQRDQRTEAERIDPVERENIAWAVTGNHLVRRKALHFSFVEAFGAQFGFGFGLAFTMHQRLALRQAVGKTATGDDRPAG